LPLIARASVGHTDTENPCATGSIIDTMLADVNGDGRPEALVLSGNQIQAHQLRRDGSTPDTGLLQHKRLTEVTDGYGAGIRYHYANAKNYPDTRHQVPSAEVVIAATEPLGEDGDAFVPQMEKTYFAYGDIEMRYSVSAQRFVSTGYGKRATLVGRPVGTGVRGTLSISESMYLADTYTSDFISEAQRDVLVGMPKRERVYEGDYAQGTGIWAALASPPARNTMRQETRHSFAAMSVPHRDYDDSMTPPALLDGRCWSKFWPYGGTSSLQGGESGVYCVGRVTTSLLVTDRPNGATQDRPNGASKSALKRALERGQDAGDFGALARGGFGADLASLGAR
jgi:hypothetical protein